MPVTRRMLLRLGRFSAAGLWKSAVLAAVFFWGTAGPARANMIFDVTFGSSITADPNAATIESTINQALAVYTGLITDNVTVALTFAEMGSGLGSSSTYIGTTSYSNYYSALSSHATSADDTTALAHLPSGPNNPVNNSTSVFLTTALLRTLGFSANPPSGMPDSTISLNTSIMNLSRSGPQNSSFYDLFAVTQHEVDEALGLLSALDGLNNGNASPTGAIGSMDLFRYDARGGRSFTTDSAAQAFFSLDGINDLVQFNQYSPLGFTADFHDWYSCPGSGNPARTQDACGSPGTQANLGVELRALDAVGYTLVSTPEPASLGLSGLACAVGLVFLRRRSASAR